MRTLIAIVITGLLGVGAIAQTVPGAVPFNSPYYQFFNTNGVPLANGYACFYASGTSTPQAVYTTASASTPIAATNGCISLDSSGSAVIWLGPSPYRFLKQDSTGTQVGPTIDGIVDPSFNWLSNVITAGAASLITFTQSGTGGNPQTVQTKLQEYVNAADFTGADMGAKINAAIASLASTYGGDVTVPPGQWTAISNTITLSYPVHLHCGTPGNDAGTPACELVFAAATDGITCADPAGRHSIIEGLYLKGPSASSAHNGINANCEYLSVKDVVVQGFPQHGISVAPSSGVANYWRFDNVHAWSNIGSGFYVSGSGTNYGTCTGCEAASNGTYDFNLDTTTGNSFVTPASNGGTSGSFTLASGAVGNTFLNPACASTGTFTIASGATGNWVQGTSAEPCAITNSGGVSNRVIYPVSTESVSNGVSVGPDPQTSGKVYKLRSGVYGANILDLYDVTDGWGIFEYNPSTKAFTWDATGVPSGPVGSYSGITVQNEVVTTGVGCTTSSGSGRTLGSIYQNTGTKPCFVSVSMQGTNPSVIAYSGPNANPASYPVAQFVGPTGTDGQVVFWVLPSSYYEVSGTGAILYWIEWQ
jgi:hypothetical protein